MPFLAGEDGLVDQEAADSRSASRSAAAARAALLRRRRRTPGRRRRTQARPTQGLRTLERDTVTPRHGCAADQLEAPAQAFFAAGKLFVADRGNNRVLIWNSVPVSSGVPADRVLGQTAMTNCAPNDALGTGSAGPRAAGGMRGPSSVWSDGNVIVVADRGNNRVLVWQQFPSQDGAPASLVLGQGNFTRSAQNDDAQTGNDGAASTARTLAQPSGVAFIGK